MAVQAFEFFKNDLLLVLGNARPAIPDLQPHLALASADAQQHRAFGITESVGKEILQNAPQQFDVAFDPQLAAAHAEFQALVPGECLELRTQHVEQLIELERLRIGVDLAIFQAGNVQQVADQVFGRAQRGVQVLYQFLCFAGQAVILVGEGGGEQSRGVQRLHQVVTDRREKARLGLIGRLGGTFGLGEGDVELRQFVGAFGHPAFQSFIGFGQRLFGLTERGDVGETHDEAATGHRVADQLDHPAIRKQPLGRVGAALAHPVQAAGDVHFSFTRATQAALGVVPNDVGNRPADADQTVRVVEQFEVAPVPRHQLQRLVDHADALGDVFDRALQQCTVELQDFGGFVGDPDDILELHLAAFNRRFHYCAS